MVKLSTLAALLVLTAAPASALAPSGVGGGRCEDPRWETVDDFAPEDAALGASGGTVLATPSDLWVGGTAIHTSTTQRWIVRTSRDANAWSTADDHFYSLGYRAHPEAIVRHPSGAIVVVGGANNASNAGAWLVRRASSRRGPFVDVDEWTYDEAMPGGFARAAALGADGTIWVGGYSPDSGPGTPYHWIVRRSDDAGLTWTVDDDVLPLASAASVGELVADEAGALYAAGYNWDGYQYRSQVRVRDATGAWTLADDYVPRPSPVYGGSLNYGAQPSGIATTGAGEVLVALTDVDDLSRARWVVRRTHDGGASWQQVDVHGPSCNVRGLAYDRPRKVLYAVGRCFVNGAYRWTVRSSADGGDTWATEDDFALTQGLTTYANGVGVSANGHVIAAGFGRDDNGVNHWLVRRRVCPR